MPTEINFDLKSQLVADFRERESSLNGQKDGHLHQWQSKGLKAFEAQVFPSTRDEEWKYTNILPAMAIAYEQYGSPLEDADIDARSFIPKEIEGSILVFLNGEFRAEASTIKDGQAFSIENILDCKHEDFGSLSKIDEQVFTALNLATFTGGVHIHVPANTEVKEPIVLLHLNDSSAGANMISTRHFITAGENARATVLELAFSINESSPTFVNAFTEVLVDQNANIDLYKIQSEGKENTTHISRVAAKQEKGSTFSCGTFTFGGMLVRNDLDIQLAGEHCESYLNGLYLGSETQLIDNHSFVDHATPNCMSDEFYKGIMDDRSKGVFNGKILVRQAAQKTNAFQSNRNILASEMAIVNTKPQLEIFADDVRCTHGATIGQINEEAIFYMQARGINKEAAKAILLLSFAGEVVDRIQYDALKPYLQARIAEQRKYEGELLLDI